MRWLKRALAVAAILAAAAALTWTIGWTLPVGHTATVRMELSARPDQVWPLIHDYRDGPRWRSDVRAVERLSDADGPLVYREERATGPLTMRVLEAIPERRLVTEIADPELPFGGRWIFQIDASGSGSRVTITEDGEIYSPLFRALARHVFGYTGTLETYAADLAGALGEAPAIESDWSHEP